MKPVHIVLHTHWDREWYFTTQDSVVLLDQAFTEILDILVKNPGLSFTMDGQISIVQEYLSIRPEKESIMKKLVSDKRLQIGPWFTQTDTFYVNGYSIINNLYIGIEETKKMFNTYMNVAYLPDTFGFSHQLPMIAHQFGIEQGIIWRGVDFDKQKIEPYFNWHAQNKNIVMKTAILHGGYGAFKRANTDAIFLQKKINGLLNEISSMTNQKQILMPVGNDQHNITADILDSIKKYGDHFDVSTYEDFFKHFDISIAPNFRGEFRETSYARVHRTSGGVRVDIKKSNYVAEQQLLRRTSPLVCMAQELGLSVSHLIVWKAWMKLFEGQAHDGIVGCVSEAVATDIINRNKQALELGISQENMIKKMIATKIGLNENQVLLFNTSSLKNIHYQKVQIFSHEPAITIKGVISCSIIATEFFPGNTEALVEKPEDNYIEIEKDYYLHTLLISTNIPEYSYQTFDILPIDEINNEFVHTSSIKNQLGEVGLENNKFYFKTNNHLYPDFIKIVHQANGGDTYDFSPVHSINEDIIEFEIDEKSVEVTQTDNYQKIQCTLSAILPTDLTKTATRNMQVKCEIELCGDEWPRIHIDMDNNVLNHNIRVGFQTAYCGTESIAQSEFGYVFRKVLQNKHIKNWESENIEYPIDIHPNSGFVGISQNKEHNFQNFILNKGVKEYQVIDDFIYFTCFSSTDELGKPDLLFRPGRASGDISKKGHIKMPTPSAQVLGSHTFEFQFIEVSTISDAKDAFEVFEQPLPFYQKQEINLFFERIDNKIDLLSSTTKLPTTFSMNEAIPFEAYTSLTPSYITGKNIIRFYTYEQIKLTDIIKKNFIIANLLEQEVDINIIEPYTVYTIRRR